MTRTVHAPIRRRHRGPGDGDGGDGGEVLAWVVTMASVFVLVTVALALALRLYAVETAHAAAEHAVEIAQTAGATDLDAHDGALGLIASSPVLDHANVAVTRTAGQVRVTVTGDAPMGGHVTASATGPVEGFTSEANR